MSGFLHGRPLPCRPVGAEPGDGAETLESGPPGAEGDGVATLARATRPDDQHAAGPVASLPSAALVVLATAASLTALVVAAAGSGPLATLSLLGAACTGAALYATWAGTAATRSTTGLLDRTGLLEAGEALLAASRRHGYPVTVVVATLEEPDGARLARVAQAWKDTARRGDLLGRVDDVFVLLLPGATPVVAEPLLARLRGAVDVPWRAGLALAGPDDDLDGLLAQAMADLSRSRPGSAARLPVPRPEDVAHRRP